jgi:alginate O-acetyltransferase complex protein AlgI
MLPNSLAYVGFVLAASAVYWALPLRFRVPSLILFGFLFYAQTSLFYLAFFVLLSFATYGCGILLSRFRSRSMFAASVVLLLGILAFFKYAQVFPGVFSVPAETSAFLLTIALPLGISFFTFEFIHYLVDVYQKKIEHPTPLSFFSFTFFFPSLVSGPIKRYEHFSAQLPVVRLQSNELFWAVCFLLLGYFQKILVADPLISFTKAVAHPSDLASAHQAIVGLYAYSIRIYADFAGLTNIAIGTALLFGIRLPKNFSYPYLSSSIAIFWRRWHISLSNWIRDYVYIPLGGNRVSLWRNCFNLLLVMTLVGMWHGPTLNFAVWGLYHGVGMAVHRVWSVSIGKLIPSNWFTKILGIIITFHFVTFGWAFFLTGSLQDSILLIKILFSPFFHG